MYHWVNGVPSCYNGCGWVQVSQTRFPGMLLQTEDSDTDQPYAIKFIENRWWIGYQGEWIGYFPGELWEGSYTGIGLAQWFGEVCTDRALTCTDMGSGIFSDSSEAAQMDDMQFLHTDGTSEPADAAFYATRPRFWDVTDLGGSSFRYGGPGGC